MSRNILIAVDGSDNSIYAVDWSVGNFLRPGDRVFLIYVFPEYVEISQDGDGLCVAIDGVTDKTRQAIERANQMLESLKGKLVAAEFDVEIVVESGDARGFIPLMCDKLAADTLVMGSRGLGGLKRVLMGSVSDYCAHNVSCPMVIVRPKQQ